jgi:hypothetical protein
MRVKRLKRALWQVRLSRSRAASLKQRGLAVTRWKTKGRPNESQRMISRLFEESIPAQDPGAELRCRSKPLDADNRLSFDRFRHNLVNLSHFFQWFYHGNQYLSNWAASCERLVVQRIHFNVCEIRKENKICGKSKTPKIQPWIKTCNLALCICENILVGRNNQRSYV